MKGTKVFDCAEAKLMFCELRCCRVKKAMKI